jgi:hypothetical protein
MSHYFGDQEAKPLEVEGVPLLWEDNDTTREPNHHHHHSSSSVPSAAAAALYPGMRRTALPTTIRNNSTETVLVPTAGNALQSVPRHVVERPNLFRVTVPENTQSGDRLLVKYNLENNNDDQYNNSRFLEVTIPQGLFPGHAFFVEIPTTPPPSSDIPVYTVTGEAIPHATVPTAEATTTTKETSDLELYKV